MRNLKTIINSIFSNFKVIWILQNNSYLLYNMYEIIIENNLIWDETKENLIMFK